MKNAYRERRIGFFTFSMGARGQAIDLEQVKQVERNPAKKSVDIRER